MDLDAFVEPGRVVAELSPFNEYVESLVEFHVGVAIPRSEQQQSAQQL